MFLTSVGNSNVGSTDGASVMAAAFVGVLSFPFEAGGRREVFLVLEADEVAISSTHSLLAAPLSLSVTLARKLQSRGQRQRRGFEHP